MRRGRQQGKWQEYTDYEDGCQRTKKDMQLLGKEERCDGSKRRKQ